MTQPKLNDFCKEVFEANKIKGFWDDRIELPIKMKESGIFSDNEIEAVVKSFKSQLLMLMVSELSEALEADRKSKHANMAGFTTMLWSNNNLESFEEKQNFKQAFECCIKDTFEDEIADEFIRLCDLCGGHKIDLEWHTEMKLKYNSLREHKHGKAY